MDLPEWVLRELFKFVFIEIVKQYYANDKMDLRKCIDSHVDLFINGASDKSRI